MKNIKKFITVALVLLMLSVFTVSVYAAPLSTVSADTDEIPYESYTYWEDFGSQEKTAVYCKPMYKVNLVLGGKSFGIASLGTVSDIYTDNDEIFVLDSDIGQIIVMNSDYTLKKHINGIYLNGEQLDINGASGIFARDGKIYVADTQHARVIILNDNGIVNEVLETPKSSLLPDDFNFRPTKIAVDSKNYTYIVSDGSYYGALVYSPEMEFIGFYGANTVKSNVIDVIQNFIDKLFSNDTKKGSSVLALPYQFNDLAVGPDDFIYTTTGNTGESIQTMQVCKMNPGGKNVLSKKEFNFADLETGVYKGKKQTQNITGIEVDTDGFFYIVDSTYGRIFWYDKECNLLSVFGGSLGSVNQKGTFQFAGCISISGTDVIVGDGLRGTVTVFSLTDYGKFVRATQLKTLNDNFDDTIDEWNNILLQDQNSQLAYRGLARAYYTLKDNHSAAKYAKLGADREIYADAYSKLRQSFLEEHFGAIFFAVIMLTASVIALVVICRRKEFKIIKNERLRVAGYNVFHPFDGARLVKEKQLGSILIATVILALYYILSAVGDTASGFAFNYFDASSYNSFYILLSTVGIVLLWTVSNWLVCVLLGGIGKCKEIFIITCYALIPMVFSSAVTLLLSHILVPDEFVFVTILQTLCMFYTFFMLMAGICKIHDFEFGKFFGTTLLTIVAMLIIIFLIFLIFLLAQQVFGWFGTVFIEAVYR